MNGRNEVFGAERETYYVYTRLCSCYSCFNSLNAEINPICHLLALLGAHIIFHISRIRVNIEVKEEFVAVKEYRGSRKWEMFIIQKSLIKISSENLSIIVIALILIFLLTLNLLAPTTVGAHSNHYVTNVIYIYMYIYIYMTLVT